MAPEIFEHEDISKDDRPAYNKKVDVWSTGVVMYCMFSNEYPFDNEDDIQWKRLYFKPRSKWEIVTVTARTLIRKMLDKEPATRLSIAEVLADAWFTSDEALMQMAQQVLMDVEHQAEMQQNGELYNIAGWPPEPPEPPELTTKPKSNGIFIQFAIRKRKKEPYLKCLLLNFQNRSLNKLKKKEL